MKRRSGGVCRLAAITEARGPSAPNSARLVAASRGMSGLGVNTLSAPPAFSSGQGLGFRVW